MNNRNAPAVGCNRPDDTGGCHGRVLCCLVMTFFLMSGEAVRAENQVVLDADRQYQYAESCFSRGDYETAEVEYNRFIYFFPEDDRLDNAMFSIGMVYYRRAHFQQAITAFSGVIEKFQNTPLAGKSAFMISDCYLHLNDTGNAMVTLQNIIAETDDPDRLDEAYYAIGWIYLEHGEFDQSKSFFQKISLKNQAKYAVNSLSAEMENRLSIPYKNPKVAGFLSIVPGAGFLYCGRYEDALVAFLLNGGLILASYKSFDQGNAALGAVIGAVEFGFYAGNIYGGISSAYKYNEGNKQNIIERLKETVKIGIAPMPYGGGELSVQMDF